MIAIILYTITFFFAVLVQSRNGAKMLRLIEGLPAAASGERHGAAAAEIAAMGRRLGMGGPF